MIDADRAEVLDGCAMVFPPYICWKKNIHLLILDVLWLISGSELGGFFLFDHTSQWSWIGLNLDVKGVKKGTMVRLL